jgi:hypothetical protein
MMAAAIRCGDRRMRASHAFTRCEQRGSPLDAAPLRQPCLHGLMWTNLLILPCNHGLAAAALAAAL